MKFLKKNSKLLVRINILFSIAILFSNCNKENIKEKYTISITVVPAGTGMVATTPSGGEFDNGTIVSLTPQPASGYKFLSWGGKDSNVILNNQLEIKKNLQITANFDKLVTDDYWVGMYTNTPSYDSAFAISMGIKNNKIVGDPNSPQSFWASAINVIFPSSKINILSDRIYSNYFENLFSITAVIPFTEVGVEQHCFEFFTDTISINQGSFIYTKGNESSPNGKTTISGTFETPNRCNGTVAYDENSTRGKVHLNLIFVAMPKGSFKK